MLLDTASLYFRAFYGVPDSFRGTGRNAGQRRPRTARLHQPGWSAPTQPTHLVCCWDNDWRPQWRVELIPSYKAHRVAQSGDAVGGRDGQLGRHRRRAGARRPGRPGAADPGRARRPGHRGGRQERLRGRRRDRHPGRARPRCRSTWSPATGTCSRSSTTSARCGCSTSPAGSASTRSWTTPGCGPKYGIPAAAYVDYATLRGDASDGLPGVAGIGEKTAADAARLATATSRGSWPRPAGPAARSAARSPPSCGAAIDYLAVAPTVVAVARDLDLGVDWDDLDAAAGRRRIPNGSPSSPSCSDWAAVPTGSWRRWPGWLSRPVRDCRCAHGPGRPYRVPLASAAQPEAVHRRPRPRRPPGRALGGLVRRRRRCLSGPAACGTSPARPTEAFAGCWTSSRRWPTGRPTDLVGGGWLVALGYDPGGTHDRRSTTRCCAGGRPTAGRSSPWACAGREAADAAALADWRATLAGADPPIARSDRLVERRRSHPRSRRCDPGPTTWPRSRR